LTANAGTPKPQAAKTGEPTEPERSHARQPQAETARAKEEAAERETKGTNTQAGAGEKPAAKPPEGKGRQAQTQPQDRGRATTEPTRREPATRAKPDITHLQKTKLKPKNHMTIIHKCIKMYSKLLIIKEINLLKLLLENPVHRSPRAI
jgi:hypothetical protein